MIRRDWWLVGGMAGVFALLIGVLQYIKYVHFGYNGLDLAIYSQTVWSLAHGHGFASSIHDPSYLGDHLEAFLIPLAGLYRLWPSPLTLLWSQTVVLAVSIVLVFILARDIIGRRGGLIAAGLFMVHPLLYNAALYEFHGLVFALPLILWMIVSYRRQHFRSWIITGLLLVIVREDMPLLLWGWVILALLDRRSTRWWLWPLVIGLGWFLAAQKMIDLANPQGHYKYLAFYQWMGTSFSSIATFPVRHPLIFLSHALAVNNWQLLFGFALGFGLAPLFRLRYTLPLVFLWIQLCLSGAQPRAILWLHYVIPYLPFLAWSTLVLVRDIRDGCFLRKFDPTWTKPLGMILCVIGPLYTQLLYGPAELPWHSVSGASVSPASILNHALTEIKPDDAVMTTFNLLNPLANREHLYSFNYLYLGRRQYSLIPYRVPEPLTMIVIDWQHLEDFQFLYRDSLFQGKTGPERLADLLQQRHLNLAEWNDGLAVYSRSGNDPYQPTEKITRPAPGPTFGNLSLVQAPSIGHPVLPTSVPGWQRQVEAAVGWQVHQRVTKPLSLRFTLAQGSRIVWESTRVLGQGTEPATEWQPNESWLTRYRLAVPDTLHGSLQLTAHLLQLDGVYQENRWRGFSPVIQSTKDLGVVNFGRLQL